MNTLHQCAYVFIDPIQELLHVEVKSSGLVSVSRHCLAKTALLLFIPAAARPGFESCVFLLCGMAACGCLPVLPTSAALVVTPYFAFTCVRFKGIGNVFMEVEEFSCKYFSIFPEDKLKFLCVNTAI